MGKVPLAQRHELARRSRASRSAALAVQPALRVPFAQRYGSDPGSRAVHLAGAKVRPGAGGRSAGPASGSHLRRALYRRPKTSMPLAATLASRLSVRPGRIARWIRSERSRCLSLRIKHAMPRALRGEQSPAPGEPARRFRPSDVATGRRWKGSSSRARSPAGSGPAPRRGPGRRGRGRHGRSGA